MRGTVGKRLLAAAVVMVALAMGGTAGWWLAMRAMPMDRMTGATGHQGAEARGMQGMQETLGMQGMAGMQGMEDKAAGRTAGHGESGPQAGAAVVRVDPVRLQRIGVRYAVAEQAPLGRTIRAEATVAYDEEHRAYVTTKVAGWVERLYVDRPGQAVRRGQPLLEIYSPELVSTERELVLALEQGAGTQMAGDSGATGRTGPMGEAGTDALTAADLVESARRRLRLWDVPESEIDRLTRTREVRRTLTLATPADGVVVEKDVLQGARVEPGEKLFQIADLSTVWVEARVFEMDLDAIRVGQPATIMLKAYPNQSFEGKVGFIYPYLDPETRTVRVRLEVTNPDGRLKPAMFATVSFDVSGDRPVLVVPASAVVQTGERAFVLVKRGEGLFEPREVQVGERAGDRMSIAEGVAPGDTVVASANFLIDSEANLMAFMGGMLGMGMPREQMRMEMRGAVGGNETKGMEGKEVKPATEGGQETNPPSGAPEGH